MPETKTKRRLSVKPRDLRSVTPYLAVRGAGKAIDWYKRVFGAQVTQQEMTPAGQVVHARLKIGDSVLMISDDFGPDGQAAARPASPVRLHLYTADVDKVYKRAVDAGAKVGMELGDQFWGERYGQITDPFGHNWSISMRIPMSKRQMDKMREEAMAMFGQGEHPGRD